VLLCRKRFQWRACTDIPSEFDLSRGPQTVLSSDNDLDCTVGKNVKDLERIQLIPYFLSLPLSSLTNKLAVTVYVRKKTHMMAAGCKSRNKVGFESCEAILK
jgi:hypothetical protein